MEVKTPNPVHRGEDGKWYFWDEVWADRLGPYESEEAAVEAMRKYITEVLGDALFE